MTEEELRDNIEDLLEDYYWVCREPKANRGIIYEEYAQKAIALFHEAGWKSGEEVDELKEFWYLKGVKEEK